MPAMKSKGGPWTERKLAALRKYMPAFNQALSKQQFKRIYIDAFAGSGSRELDEVPLLDNDADIATIAKGSAQIALETTPAFERFIFIEKSPKNAAALEALRAQFSNLDVEIRRTDANAELMKIAKAWDKKNSRGVLFLDPYGCQVEWRCLAAVASTRAIDIWLLFPLNAVRRMLPRDAAFEAGWRERLDVLFGTSAWFDRFYPTENADDLFGAHGPQQVRKVTLDGIEGFYRERLSETFQGGVCRKPLRLGAPNRDPLFSLFFACSNPSEAAKKLAHKIANDILKST
jgi:three-Cys-motif partner protein